MTITEAAARAMTKPERAAHLRACGWQSASYGGVQSWRSPDPDEHASYTLAAAIREQLRRDHRAGLPHVGDIPVVPLKREVTFGPRRDPGRSWVIDCPYCGREHTHGAGAGHRVSHCLRGDGYIIEHPAGDGGDEWLLTGEAD